MTLDGQQRPAGRRPRSDPSPHEAQPAAVALQHQDCRQQGRGGGSGTFGARAKLKAHGKSVAELAASANGELALIMDGGQINALIVEGLGLDLGEVLVVLLANEDKKQPVMVPVDCFVGQFAVNEGVMNTQALVLKTPDSTITGSGQIDLGNESAGARAARSPSGCERAHGEHAGTGRGDLQAPQDQCRLEGARGEESRGPGARRRAPDRRGNPAVRRDRREGSRSELWRPDPECRESH